MNVSEVVKLVASGNFKDVEQEWMLFIGRDDIKVDQVIALKPIVEAFVTIEKRDQAGTLAWAAVESLKERRSVEDALEATRVFLLLLNRNAELRALATELYRAVYAGRDGLEALLEEAGIAGGRPPRRAMRTLDLCLAVEPGCYVVDRNEDEAGRVASVDTSRWEIAVDMGKDSETLEPVAFADRFVLCEADDFRVLARFERDRLQVMLAKEPATVIESILSVKGDALDSEELCSILTPQIIAHGDWSKWWTKARSAVRKSRHVRIDGRSPYYLEYVPTGHDIQDEFSTEFKRIESPAAQYSAVEEFLRVCGARRETPDAAMLGALRELVLRRAERLEARSDPNALTERIVEAEIAGAIGEEDCDRHVAAMLASAEDPVRLIKTCESAALWRRACDCLKQGRPEDWLSIVVDLFPVAPGSVCEHLADIIDGSDVPAVRIDGVIGTMVTESASCAEALCWLWDKGLDRPHWQSVAPVTILARMLTMLGVVQRSDKYSPAVAKAAASAARSALSARKYVRFVACLDDIEPGMADALCTQVQRLHNLTRKIEDDLVGRIRGKFPDLVQKKAHIPRWSRENTIYTTREGLARFEAEIIELVNVKMRENAKAIGEAAEKGDLSENSEYKFALEERDLLRARLANMQQQASMAQILAPDDVPAKHISIGSKVAMKHVDTGGAFELTFLGPFDASVDDHVYNYKAPFAQEIMGTAVGDHVELPMAEPPGTYEIISVGRWRDE